MSNGFNPYKEWLQVADSGERPNHYQLLGLSTFSHDPEQINRAAQEKIRLVRTYQMGPQRGEALRIIGELSNAYACLSKAESKRAYDQRLRQAATAVEPRETLSDAPPIPIPAPMVPVEAEPIPAVAVERYQAEPVPVAQPAAVPWHAAAPVESEFSESVPQGEGGIAAEVDAADEDPGNSTLVWVVGGIAAVIGAVVLAIGFMFSGGPEVAKVGSSVLPTKTVWKSDPIPVSDPAAGSPQLDPPAATENPVAPSAETIPPIPTAPEAANPPAPLIAPFDKAAAVAAQQAWAADLKQSVEVTNSIGMKLMLIPPGEFPMGSPASEGAASSDERPQHLVRISQPYYLGQTEVTRGQYAQFATESTARDAGWKNPGFLQDDRHPVVNVSWEDGQAYCDWLSAKEGKSYRLPTEAEWEYACRAGTTSRYWHGDDAATLENDAWLASNSNRTTQPVGGKRANGFGLHDLYGNVLEWCLDWYSGIYYGEVVNAPAIDTRGPVGGTLRVFRGGSWRDLATFCQSAFRRAGPPESRGGNLGFRVLRVPDGVTVPAPPVVPTPSLAESGPTQLIAPFDRANAVVAQQEWAAHLKQSVEVTNSIGMKLLLIPPGEFQMGAPAGETDASGDEGPQHLVRISQPYYLGQFEVTRGQYA